MEKTQTNKVYSNLMGGVTDRQLTLIVTTSYKDVTGDELNDADTLKFLKKKLVQFNLDQDEFKRFITSYVKSQPFEPNQKSKDEEAQMLTSLKPMPPKGEGHTGMARTSLPEFNVGDDDVVRSASDRMMGPDFENPEAAVMPPSALKNPKKVKMKTGKRVQIVEDLSDALDEGDFGRRSSRISDDDGFGNFDEPPKPSGMSMEDIMGPNGVGNIPMESKETSIKSSAVKNAAEALMRQRQQQEAHIPQNMR